MDLSDSGFSEQIPGQNWLCPQTVSSMLLAYQALWIFRFLYSAKKHQLTFTSESNRFGLVRQSFIGSRVFSSELSFSLSAQIFQVFYLLIASLFFLYFTFLAVLKIARFIKYFKRDSFFKDLLQIFIQSLLLSVFALVLILAYFYLVFEYSGNQQISHQVVLADHQIITSRVDSEEQLNRFFIFLLLFYGLYFLRFLLFTERGLHYFQIVSSLWIQIIAGVIFLVLFTYCLRFTFYFVLPGQQDALRGMLDIYLLFTNRKQSLLNTLALFSPGSYVGGLVLLLPIICLGSVFLLLKASLLENVRVQTKYYRENNPEIVKYSLRKQLREWMCRCRLRRKQQRRFQE